MRLRIKPSPVRKRRKPSNHFFAFLPKRLSNGTWVWLETYHKYPLG